MLLLFVRVQNLGFTIETASRDPCFGCLGLGDVEVAGHVKTTKPKLGPTLKLCTKQRTRWRIQDVSGCLQRPWRLEICVFLH